MAQTSGNAKWQALSKKENKTTDSERHSYQDKGLESLAYAIVTANVEDYKGYSLKLKKLQYEASIGRVKKNAKYQKAIHECQREISLAAAFFKSDRCFILSNYHGEWIMSQLDKEIAAYNPAEEEA